MKMRFQIQLAFVIACICGLIQQAVGQTTVRLSGDEVLVTEGTITVGDIASVQNDSAASLAAIKKLDVEVFSPAVDEIVISRKQLRIRLMLAGYAVGEEEVQGPATVTVRRVETKDVRKSIEDVVRAQIVRQFGIASGDLQVTLDPQFKNPIGDAGFSSIAVTPWSRPNLPLGKQSLTLTAVTASGVSTFKAPVSIAVIRELAIANAEISPGTELSMENVVAVRRPVSRLSNSYLTLKQAIGRTVRTRIGKYAVVKQNQLQVARAKSNIMIERNSLINVVVQRGPLTVTLRDVKAMTNGKKGGRVELLNPHTNERMSARVVDEHTARVF